MDFLISNLQHEEEMARKAKEEEERRKKEEEERRIRIERGLETASEADEEGEIVKFTFFVHLVFF